MRCVYCDKEACMTRTSKTGDVTDSDDYVWEMETTIGLCSDHVKKVVLYGHETALHTGFRDYQSAA